MERKIDDKTILERFLEDFVEIVERHCKYIVVSGFVAIAHGRSRGTEDIDMILERLDKNRFKDLFDDLIRNDFECMQSSDAGRTYEDYLKENLSIRFTRKNEFLPEMEIKLAKDELDDYQIKTRRKLEFTGLDVWFSSIEMNIAFKEELLKSDKDLEDAKHLRIIYKGKINENEVKKIKKKIKELRLKEG